MTRPGSKPLGPMCAQKPAHEISTLASVRALDRVQHTLDESPGITWAQRTPWLR